MTPLVVHEEEEGEDGDDEAGDDEDHHNQAAVHHAAAKLHLGAHVHDWESDFLVTLRLRLSILSFYNQSIERYRRIRLQPLKVCKSLNVFWRMSFCLPDRGDVTVLRQEPHPPSGPVGVGIRQTLTTTHWPPTKADLDVPRADREYGATGRYWFSLVIKMPLLTSSAINILSANNWIMSPDPWQTFPSNQYRFRINITES